MDRRSFLKLGAATAAAGGCAPKRLFGQVNGSVVIIGAGAAGCYAAYILRNHGVQVTVLEAASRAGGRMGKHTGFADFDIDLGAQWEHGDYSIVGALIETSGAETFRDRSDLVYWYKGERVETLPKVLRRAGNRSANNDISILDHYNANGCGEDEYFLITGLTGDVGASPELISAYWEERAYDQASAGSDDHKFVRTYFDLIQETVIDPVHDVIEVDTVVESIDQDGDVVQVTATDGRTWQADRVIVAVPLTVLQDGDISFSPALPDWKLDAVDQLGMEPGMKAFLRFSERFFDQNIVGGSVCAAYVDESYNRDTDDHVLFGFVMGTQAAALHELGEDGAVAALLEELDEMYDGKASETFIDAFIQDWTAEPHVRGAYSYPRVGATADTRADMAAPVRDRLFFAGEATNDNGHHATVHGAIETGWREAIAVLESLDA